MPTSPLPPRTKLDQRLLAGVGRRLIVRIVQEGAGVAVQDERVVLLEILRVDVRRIVGDVVDHDFVRLPNVSIILATSGIGVWMNPTHLLNTSTLRGRLGLAAARSGSAASIACTWLSNGRRGCGSFNAARSSASATAPVLPVSAV